jgi:hypothetical protein
VLLVLLAQEVESSAAPYGVQNSTCLAERTDAAAVFAGLLTRKAVRLGHPLLLPCAAPQRLLKTRNPTRKVSCLLYRGAAVIGIADALLPLSSKPAAPVYRAT